MKEGNSRGRTRTCDPPVNSRLLYQLSYSGMGREIWPSQRLNSTGARIEQTASDGVRSGFTFAASMVSLPPVGMA